MKMMRQSNQMHFNLVILNLLVWIMAKKGTMDTGVTFVTYA